MHGVITIAATEIRIGLRNRWIILSSLILLAFALILVLLGSAPGGEVKTDAVTVVVASLSTLSVYLVPLIALLLSFDAIAGEIDGDDGFADGSREIAGERSPMMAVAGEPAEQDPGRHRRPSAYHWSTAAARSDSRPSRRGSHRR